MSFFPFINYEGHMAMLEFVTVFVLKLIDQALNTYKTVLLVKGRRAASALTNAISAGTFLVIVQRMQTQDSDSILYIAAVCLATFLGSFLTQYAADKHEKDRIFIFEITPKSSESGKRIADLLRSHDLPVMTYKGYNGHMELVLCVRVFTRSKAESHLVESLLKDESECKWSMVETRTIAQQS